MAFGQIAPLPSALEPDQQADCQRDSKPHQYRPSRELRR
jgi:hypothetical protein